MDTQHKESMKTSMGWKGIFKLGGAATVLILIGIIIDIIFGSSSGGNLTALPQTAVERFDQLQNNPLLGLYNLDFLNVINQIIFIPAYFALYAAHRKTKPAFAHLSFIIFIIGSIIFITNNTALTMLDLSRQYFSAATEQQKILIAAAGEAMLAKGMHGNLGVFIGFFLPNIAGVMMSFVMLRGKVFSKVTSYLGIAGNSLMVLYVILVTFLPQAKEQATLFAAPGGICIMAWMVMFAITLFRMPKQGNK